MTKIIVTSSYVPLRVKHLSREAYEHLGRRLMGACSNHAQMTFWDPFPFDQCWLYRELPHGNLWETPAAPTPSDRYDTPAEYVKSNIVQHNRTQWAVDAWKQFPDADVVVWLDYGILKQGGWNNNQLTEEHVGEFLDKVAAVNEWNDIPFPGIEGKKPVDIHGNNWRFCGSTHIWPTKYLMDIHRAYQFETRKFIRNHQCVPLDLAIWPAVEENSGLPFRWYKAEYDASQLTNFPG